MLPELPEMGSSHQKPRCVSSCYTKYTWHRSAHAICSIRRNSFDPADRPRVTAMSPARGGFSAFRKYQNGPQDLHTYFGGEKPPTEDRTSTPRSPIRTESKDKKE